MPADCYYSINSRCIMQLYTKLNFIMAQPSRHATGPIYARQNPGQNLGQNHLFFFNFPLRVFSSSWCINLQTWGHTQVAHDQFLISKYVSHTQCLSMLSQILKCMRRLFAWAASTIVSGCVSSGCGHMAGKRDFGSFYSSNVGELIAIPEVTCLTCVSTLLHANSLLSSTAHVCHDCYQQRLTAGIYVLYMSHTRMTTFLHQFLLICRYLPNE